MVDFCPKCGHYMMSYSQRDEAWECYCHTVIYNNKNNNGCHCKHVIRESEKQWDGRLGEQNRKGIYWVGVPLATISETTGSEKGEGKQ
jgi:DNA-directed RNA polymerase subunit M/transcription elongation factor TFIIS